ncbi:MAG TPA: amino acid adenylation domain-containing protein [Acidobacteriaceae bacterium]|nr:amino acid adenylation domain-containing protein [Acidobacteriaceae bacterium]
MNAEQLLSELRTLDIQISVDGDRLRCSAPEGRLTKDLEQKIQVAKPELLRALGASSRAAAAVPRRAEGNARLPLSFAQERFWLLQNLDPQSTAYNITAVLPLPGRLDQEALEWALDAVVRRREVLRTRFPEERGLPVQVIAEEAAPSLEVWDGTQLPATERQSGMDAQIREASRQQMDLQRGPLLRVKVLRTGEEEQSLVLTVHHILCDAWGLGILLSELKSFYGQKTGGREWQAPALPIQYGDYAVWERQREAAGAFGSQLEYWKEKLRDVPRYLDLPTDRPHSVSLPFAAKLQPLRLDADTSKRLRDQMAGAGVTPFMGLLAVFQALLHRYTRQQTIVVGTPISTRTRPELERLIGCLINTHALRCDFREGLTTRELLQQVRTTVLDALSHSDVPFERVVSEVVRERNLARSPLFQTAFIEQNTPHAGEFSIVSGGTTFDLTGYVWETESGFAGSIEYDGHLFDASTIACLAGAYTTLAAGMARNPDTPIDELPLVSEEQEAEWFGESRGAGIAVPEESVAAWIERQAKKTPQAVAVVCGPESLTYREVSERSSQLANRLRKMGVGPETVVALCLERSADLVVAPLAVWKAGGAYVPIDPYFPASRVALMLQDSEAAVLVTESGLLHRMPAVLPPVMCLDRERATLAKESREAPVPATSGSSLAYVLYTSGSTGIPKGVEITHAALTNFLLSMRAEPGMGASDRLLAVTTFSFDIAGLELYLPLVSGARVVIAPREATLEGAALAALIQEQGITAMQATPVTWRMLLRSGWKTAAGMKVLSGGEALPRDLAEALLATGAEVWNLYGPTETTIWSTVDRVRSGDKITIGRPIANTDVYVLDEQGAPVPPGVAGELYIGGRGLARGYRHREVENRERFIRSARHGGARLYRTGDVVRRLADGRIECLGRADHQVKLRGYRIELGEIEAALQRRAEVRQAVVVIREDVAGDPRLVAYLAMEEGTNPDAAALRAALVKVLPDYMIPSLFRQVEAFPLTANRKVDRKALQGPEFAPGDGSGTTMEMDPAGLEQAAEPPRNHVETVMAEVWREALNSDAFGVFDDFFVLGGHSLSAAAAVARLRTELEMDLPLRSIFLDPTIAGLASHIAYDPALGGYRYSSEIPEWNCLVPVQPRGTRTPLFFITGYQNPDDTLQFLTPLIQYFGRDQPVFGFRPRWTFGGADYESVEEMAREFLKELRAVQPQGPYLLAGMCVGGIAALEVARELMNQGEQIQLMLLVDTDRPGPDTARAAERNYIRRRMRHIREVLGTIAHSGKREKVQIVRTLVRRKMGWEDTPEIVEQDRYYESKMRYWRMLYAHCPQRYPGRLVLIVNEEQHRISPDLGWPGYADGGLEILTSPGTHQTMFTEHRRAVAERVLQCIEEATGAAQAEIPAEAAQ